MRVFLTKLLFIFINKIFRYANNYGFYYFIFFVFILNILKSKTKTNQLEFQVLTYGDSMQSNAATIVSCYFYSKNSKHQRYKYNKWLKNFFQSVSSPLVLFTDYKSIDHNLLKKRQNKITQLYIYNSKWDILKEIEFKRNKSYTFNYKFIQNNLDPEKHIHNPDLYLIWNIKSYITNKIAQRNPFKSSMFIYTDCGAWRKKPILNWPNVSFIRHLSNDILKDKILFSQISNFSLEKSKSFPVIDLIEGGFFMGSNKAISNLEFDFWKLHDERLVKGYFIGKDQTIMNILAYNSYNSSRSKIARLQAWNSLTDCSFKIDKWFFYQYFLANDEYYLCNGNKETLVIPDHIH